MSKGPLEGTRSTIHQRQDREGSRPLGPASVDTKRPTRSRLGRLTSRLLIPLSLLPRQAAGVSPTNTTTTTAAGAVGRPIPLVVTNNCHETLWPGIGTQNGIGPGTGGFALEGGTSMQMYVSPDWQGRVWGRTNCSFNNDGSGPSNLNGVNGNGAACSTGDCFGRLDCEFTGQVPTTLAEFNLIGGMDGKQTFYDISLVDGYNLPLAIVYIPAKNTTWIPPNLTNCACIASSGYLGEPSRTGLAYTNATFPMPYESAQTNRGVADWCPWDLQEYPPSRPGDGIYPYPDDHIQRPVFDPCLSACASTNNPEDCCTGEYNDPNVCRPSLYSEQAKAVCPDAYSYAFDDQTSTFIIPTGGGWQVVFCPEGRSTNILETFGPQLRALGSGGGVTREMLDALTNITYIATHPPPSSAGTLRPLRAWSLLGTTAILWAAMMA
ncbi:thaumatin family protein [Lasiosphaeria ovina]|uniref:Thaumatin family protein n=1 Tax=Lasiosphaeria ovina TaxID=92902 RepID=A0AAE0NL24_9PEZI|nr:thaumatin family protein [Lasiosphaeria ovina]